MADPASSRVLVPHPQQIELHSSECLRFDRIEMTPGGASSAGLAGWFEAELGRRGYTSGHHDDLHHDAIHHDDARRLVVEVRRAPTTGGGVDLPAEGYLLETTRTPQGGLTVVTGADDRGCRYGLATLAQLVTPAQPVAPAQPVTPARLVAPAQPLTPAQLVTPARLVSPARPVSSALPVSSTGLGRWQVPQLTVRDWPSLSWRGSIEGFYGPPWTHQDRLDHLRFLSRHRLTSYVYAPKDDPYHRRLWREPYPEPELVRLRELVTAAREADVTVVMALSPGLSMHYSDDAEHSALADKARQLQAIGIDHFALLFDDIPTELQQPADRAAFGSAQGAAGAAHGVTCARFADAVTRPAGTRLVMVPTDYAGGDRSAYRAELDRTLPPDVLLWWTGSDIVVGEVTRADIDAAAASYRRPLVLWDNFPVNDFDRARCFLGPLLGRTGHVDGSALHGISANPMIEAAPSQLALATIGAWAWNPAAYDPSEAAARALVDVAGPLAPEIAALVDVCSSWPPSAPQSPHLAAMAAAVWTEPTARTELAAALRAIAAVPEALRQHPGSRLAEQLLPWADAGRAMAGAGLAAVDVLTAEDGMHDVAVLRERARVALEQAEQHYPSVLRDLVPALARTTLVRTDPGGPAPRQNGQLVALLVTGVEPAPGDGSLTGLLEERGYAVQATGGTDPLTVVADAEVGVVVVTRSSTQEHAVAAAALPAPLLTWAHLVGLGLASSADMLTVQDTIHLTEAFIEAAAAFSTSLFTAGQFPAGPLTVYRGPGTVTWGETGPEAVVLARSSEGRPALAHYPPGSRLVDGRLTAHGATLLFLGREGLSPWLMNEAGRALVQAVVEAALADRAMPGAPPAAERPQTAST